MTPGRYFLMAASYAAMAAIFMFAMSTQIEWKSGGFSLGISKSCAQGYPTGGTGSAAQGCAPDVVQYLETARRSGIEYNQRVFDTNIAPPMTSRGILQDCLGSILDGNPMMFFNFPSLDQLLSGMRNQICSTMRNMVSQVTGPMGQSFSMPGRDIGGFHIPGGSAGMRQTYGGGTGNGNFVYDQGNGSWYPGSRYMGAPAQPSSSGGFTGALKNLFK